MDVIMPIVFFILFIILVAVIMYLIYDYMEYKDNVDKSFDITTKHVNDNFAKVSEDIDEAGNKIEQTNKNVNSVALRTDTVKNSLDTFRSIHRRNIDDINYNFAVTENNDRFLNTGIESNRAELNDFRRRYTSNLADINYNFGVSLENDGILSKSIGDFDSALKKYFKFSENGQSLMNDKLFQHAFSGINPNLELLSQVHTASGVTITTPLNKIDNKNLRICNNNNNCVNMNVDNDAFNITPDNLNNLVVNSKNNRALARFDLQNDGIYFGGADVNAPMFIQDSNLYLNNVNFIVKEEGTVYSPSQNVGDLTLARVTGADLYEIGTGIEELQKAIVQNSDKLMDIYQIYAPLLDKDTVNSIVNSTNQCIVQYSMDNANIKTQSLQFKLYIPRDVSNNSTIQFQLPYSEIGKIVESQNINIENTDNTSFINTTQSQVTSDSGFIKFNIKVSSNIPKNSFVFFKVNGSNSFSLPVSPYPKFGVAIGIINMAVAPISGPLPGPDPTQYFTNSSRNSQ